VSIIFGVIVPIFPKVLNYLVGAYLILLGLWFIFGLGGGLIIGIISLTAGIYLIVAGIAALGRYFGWWYYLYFLL
jgi:hypothetical protein